MLFLICFLLLFLAIKKSLLISHVSIDRNMSIMYIISMEALKSNNLVNRFWWPVERLTGNEVIF